MVSYSVPKHLLSMTITRRLLPKIINFVSPLYKELYPEYIEEIHYFKPPAIDFVNFANLSPYNSLILLLILVVVVVVILLTFDGGGRNVHEIGNSHLHLDSVKKLRF